MGRDRKEYKDLHIKCEEWIYNDLKETVDKYNNLNKTNVTITKVIEVAIYEYIQNLKNELN